MATFGEVFGSHFQRVIPKFIPNSISHFSLILQTQYMPPIPQPIHFLICQMHSVCQWCIWLPFPLLLVFPSIPKVYTKDSSTSSTYCSPHSKRHCKETSWRSSPSLSSNSIFAMATCNFVIASTTKSQHSSTSQSSSHFSYTFFNQFALFFPNNFLLPNPFLIVLRVLSSV